MKAKMSDAVRAKAVDEEKLAEARRATYLAMREKKGGEWGSLLHPATRRRSCDD